MRRRAGPASDRPRLVLGVGAGLYLGSSLTAGSHAHHAVQLVVGLDGPIDVVLEDGARSMRAALVASGVEHGIDAKGRLVVVLVDREAQGGAALDRVARERHGEDLAAHLTITSPPSEASPRALLAWADALHAPLREGGARPARAARSPAVRAALEHVHATLDGRPRLEEAAACAGISASRLTHLFSEEVGLPFRRYVLWARAKRALSEVRGGATLTRAAVASGFSDAAHLSRTFRRMFGLAPSSLFELADIDGDADE